MGSMTWEELGAELLAHDRWGDFEAAKSHPKAKEWPRIAGHPVCLMVNGCAAADHYIPILLRALDELTNTVHLDMVVRALTRKDMKIAVARLLQFFQDYTYADDWRFLSTVGYAIYVIAPRDRLEDFIRICRDVRFGQARHGLVVHLSRFKKSEDAFQTLLLLLDEESVRGCALEALKRYGDIRAIPAIERTPVRDGDNFIYERHQKMMALKKLNEKKDKQSG